jgi:hypothetical protein
MSASNRSSSSEKKQGNTDSSRKHGVDDQSKPIPANPLPPDKIEGDSADTDQWDDNDTPPRRP